MFERLTFRDSLGVACYRWELPSRTEVIANEAISRLAAYEDSELEPEEFSLLSAEKIILHNQQRDLEIILKGASLDRIRELTNADRDGRLVILPVKIGDTVYITGGKYRRGKTEYWINTGKFKYSDMELLGKTVFLTREAAEKALDEMQKKDKGEG